MLPEVGRGIPLSRVAAEKLTNGVKVYLLSDYKRGTHVSKGTIGCKTGFHQDTGNMVVTFGNRTGACPRPDQLAIYRGQQNSGDIVADQPLATLLSSEDAMGGKQEAQRSSMSKRVRVRTPLPAAVVLAADLLISPEGQFAMEDKVCFAAWHNEFGSEAVVRELSRRWIAAHTDPMDAAAAAQEGDISLTATESAYLDAWKAVIDLQVDQLDAFIFQRRKAKAKAFAYATKSNTAQHAVRLLQKENAAAVHEPEDDCCGARAWARTHPTQFRQAELRIQWEAEHKRSSKAVKDHVIQQWAYEKEFGRGEWVCSKCGKHFESPSTMYCHMGMKCNKF